MFDVDITIIGAGVIGLAIAKSLSPFSSDIIVLEQHTSFGQETSSRNSEVIHAGIYYAKDSLRANLCVEGKEMLYDYCEKNNLPHRRCGKLVVATSEVEILALEQVWDKAKQNGVNDLIWLSQEDVMHKEPHIKAVGALFSPSTGIIDSHWYLKQLETDAVNGGVQFAYGSRVINLEVLEEGYRIDVEDETSGSFSFTTRMLVNAAGLEAYRIASMLGVDDERLRINFCKGEYFRVQPPKNKLVRHLVYPVPSKDALGIHVTIDMGGGLKLGPDVEYMDENRYDYAVNPIKKSLFFQSTKRYLPFLEESDLVPEMAGIRAKVQTKEGPPRDFYIEEETKRGLPGLVNLIGMESPGLTASLAIGKYVSRLLFPNK